MRSHAVSSRTQQGKLGIVDAIPLLLFSGDSTRAEPSTDLAVSQTYELAPANEASHELTDGAPIPGRILPQRIAKVMHPHFYPCADAVAESHG